METLSQIVFGSVVELYFTSNNRADWSFLKLTTPTKYSVNVFIFILLQAILMTHPCTINVFIRRGINLSKRVDNHEFVSDVCDES